MTDKFPRISGEQLIKYLIKKGFTVTRQRGSHVSLRSKNVFTSVPRKKTRLGIGIIFAILKDAKISKDEFLDDFGSGFAK